MMTILSFFLLQAVSGRTMPAMRRTLMSIASTPFVLRLSICFLLIIYYI